MGKKTYPTLATAAEIRRIAARAHKTLDRLSRTMEDVYDTEAHEASYQIERGAKEALRFCATAAALLGDVSLMPVIVRALEIQEFWNDQADSDTGVVAHSLTTLLRAGAEITPRIRGLASHDDQRWRAAVAAGLRPQGEASLALLEELARDPIYEVRRPALATLSKVREVPWWLGKFGSDPYERLSEEEAERHRPTLERLSSSLDVPRYDLVRRQSELAQLAETLPDELVIDLVQTTLAAKGYDKPLTVLGTLMLTREGGADALIRLCEFWAEQPISFYGDLRVEIVSNAPPEVRLATCMKLARYACAQGPDARNVQGGAADIAASIAGKAFPEGADLGPLLDVVLAIELEEPETGPDAKRSYKIDWVTNGLSHAFGSDNARPESIADRLIEARLEGYPGVWGNLRASADKLASRIPREVLRPAAERALHHLDDDTVRWAIQCLIKEAHDPNCDPAPHQLVAKLCDDGTRWRRIITRSVELRKYALPWLRRNLREDALSFEEATVAISVIDGFWCSMDPPPFLGTLGQQSLLDDTRTKERRKYEAMLQAPDVADEFLGPVSDAEWAALRHARATKISPSEWRSALMVLPKGPWQPEDRAFFEQVLARCDAGKVELALPIAHALAGKCNEEDLPIFDRMIKHAPEHKSFIRRCLYDARVSLGLPAKPEKPQKKDGAGAHKSDGSSRSSGTSTTGKSGGAQGNGKKGRPKLFLVPEAPDGPGSPDASGSPDAAE